MSEELSPGILLSLYRNEPATENGNKTPCILVVDDEPDIREFISYNLSKKGYRVFTATNGKTGYELAVEQKPDLIILDVMMPLMNGYETCVRLRNNPDLKHVKIIFLSAISQVYVSQLSDQLKADDFLNKPIHMDALMQRVDDWLKIA